MAELPQPRMAALDRPALGLMLQLAALSALPASLSLATAIFAEGLPERGLGALVVLQVVAAGLQLAVGIAIARRSLARPLFAAYGAATVAVAVAAVAVFAGDESSPLLAAGALEILAGPLVILGAPLVVDVRQLPDRRSPADAAAALIVLAVSSLIALPVNIFVDLIRDAAASRDALLQICAVWAVRAAFAVVPALVALRAGRALLRSGPPAAARRALAIYVLVTIGADVVFQGITIAELLASGSFQDHRALILSTPAAGLIGSVATPLVIWAYARPVLREPIAVARPALAAPLTWGVLWYVPLLLTRSPVLGALRPLLGTVFTAALGALFCAQAVANVAAARAALRGRGFRTAAGAAAITIVLLGLVLGWLYTQFRADAVGTFGLARETPVWPVTLLIAMLATLAWSQRGAPGGSPVAAPAPADSPDRG